MRVSEIRVKQIRVNQGLGVHFNFLFLSLHKKVSKCLEDLYH